MNEQSELERWRIALGLGAGIVFDPGQFTGTGGVNAEVYLEPLINDRRVPLGLLAFVQHPTTLGVSAGKGIHDWGASGGATVFVDDQTALGGFIGGGFDPASSATTVSGGARLVRYLIPTARGELGYNGSRRWTSVGTWTFDGARVGLTLLFDSVLLGAGLDVGRVFQFETSFYSSPQVSLSWFVNRRWALWAELTLGWNIFGSIFGGQPRQMAVTNQSIGGGTQVYLREFLYVGASWTSAFQQIPQGFTAPGDAARHGAELHLGWKI